MQALADNFIDVRVLDFDMLYFQSVCLNDFFQVQVNDVMAHFYQLKKEDQNVIDNKHSLRLKMQC